MRVLRYSSKLAAVEDPKTWLARIAWRVAIDRRRQRGRTSEIPLEDPEKPVAEVASPTFRRMRPCTALRSAWRWSG